MGPQGKQDDVNCECKTWILINHIMHFRENLKQFTTNCGGKVIRMWKNCAIEKKYTWTKIYIPNYLSLPLLGKNLYSNLGFYTSYFQCDHNIPWLIHLKLKNHLHILSVPTNKGKHLIITGSVTGDKSWYCN